MREGTKLEPELQEIIEAYRARGAARDQNELVQLLREAQALYGGVLPQTALDDIAAALGLKRTFLDAVLKRYPSIKTEAARHTLAVCCGKNCAKRDALADFVREEYGVQPGGVAKAGFRFQAAGCMKNCGKGPCVKWDGEIHTGMTAEKLRQFIAGQK